ncbi:MAG: hypothetical protein IT469_01705 [Pseudomonadales bacterium]|nr:hypothetical protein [Pseudomonadales bacterium]
MPLRQANADIDGHITDPRLSPRPTLAGTIHSTVRSFTHRATGIVRTTFIIQQDIILGPSAAMEPGTSAGTSGVLVEGNVIPRSAILAARLTGTLNSPEDVAISGLELGVGSAGMVVGAVASGDISAAGALYENIILGSEFDSGFIPAAGGQADFVIGSGVRGLVSPTGAAVMNPYINFIADWAADNGELQLLSGAKLDLWYIPCAATSMPL